MTDVLLDTEEHLLRALDADPGDRAALAALADLLLERGEENAAAWVRWAMENDRSPMMDDPSCVARGWQGPKLRFDEAYRRHSLPGALYYDMDCELAFWRLFVHRAKIAPFDGGSWT